MRPTRSIQYCYDCGYRKIRFESEEKAMNFIRFNAEDIKNKQGYAPVRAYFCISCGCYHLTSKAQRPYKCKSRTQKVLAAYKSMTKKTDVKNRVVMRYYSAEEMGLTFVQDEKLQQTLDTNLRNLEYKKEYLRLKHEADCMAKLIRKLQKEAERPKKECQWLKTEEAILCKYETKLSEWKDICLLSGKCEKLIKRLRDKDLLDENRLMADSIIERAETLLVKLTLAMGLIKDITLVLQDTCSYLMSDMYASANGTLKTAEKVLAQLLDLQFNGLSGAIETWENHISSYKNVLKDKIIEW